MFIQNRYKDIYFSIIEKAKHKKIYEYGEKHHIIPKCLGGSNEKSNIVMLTAREHFLCHKLLVKFTESENKCKMSYALWRCANKGGIKTTLEYTHIRQAHAKMLALKMTGKTWSWSQEAKDRLKEKRKIEPFEPHNKGKSRTQEEKNKISKSKKGKCIGKDNHFYGKTHSDEFKLKQSQRAKDRFTGVPKQKSKCIHCGLLFAPNVLNRFHMDNCKLKK